MLPTLERSGFVVGADVEALRLEYLAASLWNAPHVTGTWVKASAQVFAPSNPMARIIREAA
jgi:hypothetical protein